MSFAPRFLLLFALVLFPWGCGQDTELPTDDTPQAALDFADESLAGELDDAQAQQLLEHLNQGEVQEATALLAQLNLDNPKNEKVRVLLMGLYLLNGNQSAARALINSGWPTGQMWFERLKSRHDQNALLGDITAFLGQRIQSKPRSGDLNIHNNDGPRATGASLPQPVGPTMIDGFIPLQRSEVNNALNVAFEVDATTTAIINAQGFNDVAVNATQNSDGPIQPRDVPDMERTQHLKGMMHLEFFDNNDRSDVWATMTWRDQGSKLSFPAELDNNGLYGTTTLFAQEFERQNLILHSAPTKS